MKNFYLIVDWIRDFYIELHNILTLSNEDYKKLDKGKVLIIDKLFEIDAKIESDIKGNIVLMLYDIRFKNVGKYKRLFEQLNK